MPSKVDDRELLKMYRTELAEIAREMAALSQRRQAIAQIVAGLEILVGRQYGPQTAEDAEEDAAQPEGAEVTVTDAALYVLRNRHEELGAKEIERGLDDLGYGVNYYTLYKALRRAATRGLLYKNGEKYGLREWRERGSPKTNA